jgi:mycothiol synthase
MRTPPLFPQDFQIRAATMEDLGAVVHLLTACDLADSGEPQWSEESLRSLWQADDVQVETDTWIVVAPNEELAGYAALRRSGPGRIRSFLYVLPAYRGTGIEPHLLKQIETWVLHQGAEVFAQAQVKIVIQMRGHNREGQKALEEAGYTLARSFSIMEIILDRPFPSPQWAEGITVRPFIPEQDEHAVYTVDEEIATDERDHRPMTFEEWKSWYYLDQEQFDPTLWVLASAGNELVGMALNRSARDKGEILHLGVHRSWRHKGLGMALLLHTFATFMQRDISTISLSVDTQSLTGANRLYERAGMSVTDQYHTYEKRVHAESSASSTQDR